MPDTLDAARQIAETELGRGGGLLYNPIAWNLILLHAILTEICAEYGSLSQIRSNQNMGGLSTPLKITVEQSVSRWLDHPATSTALLSFPPSWYHQRLTELVFDRILSEPLAPPVLLSPEKEAGPPNDLPFWAVVYNDTSQIANELYVLMIDAYAAEERTVVGIHIDDIEQSATEKTIWWDEDADVLREAELIDPIIFDGALLLGLGPDREAESHGKIRQRLGQMKLLNPPEAAKRCDDKSAALKLWSQFGVPSPATASIDPRASHVNVTEAINELPAGDAYISKPVSGTGATGVHFWNSAEVTDDVMRELYDHPFLIQTWVRLAMTVHPFSGAVVPFVLRLHVVDGSVESGYAVVGNSPEDRVISVARGARPTPIDRAMAQVFVAGVQRAVTQKEWQGICQVAESAHSAINSGLTESEEIRITGIDLVPTDQNGNLVGVVLEANARPAGLAHGLAVGRDPLMARRPTVSEKLWGCRQTK